jgi:adenosine kinase
MSKLEGALLGIGNPLLDISANVEKEFLTKYDVKLNNAILCEEKHKPIYDELCDTFKPEFIAGGATQNSIRVAQWMLQEQGATAYIGCVGKDKFGKQLSECAQADGVAVHYLEDEKTPTGTCAVLINEKERSLIANLSAANNYKKEHFDTADIKKVWEKAQFVYSAGFFLTVSPPTVQQIGQHCADTNKVFCMNLSAPFITQFFTDPLMAAIPFVDYMFGNESEAAAFGEKQGYKDQSVEGVATEIAKLPKTNTKRPRVCIITQGKDDTVVVKDGKVTKYPVEKLAEKDIVDVNGAGDSFVGGFLAALMQGKPEAECIKAGHYAASVILKVSGCVLSGKPAMK